VKERLTGAIILVVLIVLLVPELLSGPKGPAASAPAGPAPNSTGEAPLRSYTINLGDDSHSPTAAAGSGGPAMPQPNGPEQPAVQAQPNTSPAATPNAPPATPSTPAATPNAPEAGKHTTSPAGTPARRTPTAQAQKLASARKPASSPAQNSEAGWAVQLGVFASRENAERLAMEVRVKGFKVSVAPLMSGSRKLYRVRVGPTADRTAAQELQGRLKAAGRPGGTVVPYS